MQGTSPQIMHAQILIPPKRSIKRIIVVSSLIKDIILSHRNIPIMDLVVYILSKKGGGFVNILRFSNRLCIAETIQYTTKNQQETPKKYQQQGV